MSEAVSSPLFQSLHTRSSSVSPCYTDVSLDYQTVTFLRFILFYLRAPITFFCGNSPVYGFAEILKLVSSCV